MSVQRQSVPASKDADLESTAELPVLDVAAYEAELAEERTGARTRGILPAHVGGSPSLPCLCRRSRTACRRRSSARMQLEIDLRSLSESLRDVEERLTRKGERLVELERELANARATNVLPPSSAADVARTCAPKIARTGLGRRRKRAPQTCNAPIGALRMPS